jgi:hypothetical protein
LQLNSHIIHNSKNNFSTGSEDNKINCNNCKINIGETNKFESSEREMFFYNLSLPMIKFNLVNEKEISINFKNYLKLLTLNSVLENKRRIIFSANEKLILNINPNFLYISNCSSNLLKKEDFYYYIQTDYELEIDSNPIKLTSQSDTHIDLLPSQFETLIKCINTQIEETPYIIHLLNNNKKNNFIIKIN